MKDSNIHMDSLICDLSLASLKEVAYSSPSANVGVLRDSKGLILLEFSQSISAGSILLAEILAINWWKVSVHFSRMVGGLFVISEESKMLKWTHWPRRELDEYPVEHKYRSLGVVNYLEGPWLVKDGFWF
ncbi:hypothetical protein GQ457_17G019000 [Hibiscus cannabinus]